MHHTHIKVRGYHLDVYQHVNNARYLEFLEEARWGWLEDSGDMAWFQQHQIAFVVVNININYRAAATLGQQLRIDTCLGKLSERSGVVSQQVFLEGTDTLVADAAITFVCLDQKTGKALPMTGELAEFLQKHLEQG
ncbi:thioesterase family protein [Gallaecimonas kandeliae]|uniref:acyl-CoA thioesterase n=1 Tax=Gallaecimonas kandeliae TaxID=3029055 RepID=UPI002647EB61|nr:thioesterase family protein [Gallaecimonas kandeliae]WKE63965.1 thioesterase family protein [Gallaecimonas kandeliae]